MPGYRKLTDPAARAHVAQVWGVGPDSLPGPGRSAYELLDALGRDIRALLLMGSNPVVSAPRAAHVEERIRSLDFLAVCDVVLSETAELADVVLPVTQWAEETGTTTNLEGRVLLRRRAIPSAGRAQRPGGAARAGGAAGRRGQPRKALPDRPRGGLRGAAPGERGRPCGLLGDHVPAARRGERGVLALPRPTGDCRGDRPPRHPRLFLDRFATEDGRARFVPVSHRAVAEEPDEEYPVLLTTGRVVAQYQSGAQTRRVEELNSAAPGPFVELHPRLAQRIGAAEGEPVAVVSRRGRAVAPARITTSIRADTVFMPFHWAGEGRANTLTNPALDPTSRMPEFKACAVRLEAVRPERTASGTGAGQPTPTALQAAATALYSAPPSP